MKRVKRVRPAIWRTSQPLQTGSSFCEECGAGANPGEGNEAGEGARICGSLSSGGGSNGGISGVDKQILFDYCQFTE